MDTARNLLLAPALSTVLVIALSPIAATAPQQSEEKILPWNGDAWSEGWGAKGSANYMRPLGDGGWKTRMLALQKAVKGGDKAVPALLTELENGSTEGRIFAAQALGFVPAKAAKDQLLTALENDKSAAVRLYSADSIGMNGLGEELKSQLEELRNKERNRDVKKHVSYVLGRGAEAIEPDVIKDLANWDAAENLDTAKLGKPAPDFELAALNGDSVRLRDFRGKSPVVLVFIYGDT